MKKVNLSCLFIRLFCAVIIAGSVTLSSVAAALAATIEDRRETLAQEQSPPVNPLEGDCAWEFYCSDDPDYENPLYGPCENLQNPGPHHIRTSDPYCIGLDQQAADYCGGWECVRAGPLCEDCPRCTCAPKDDDGPIE